MTRPVRLLAVFAVAATAGEARAEMPGPRDLGICCGCHLAVVAVLYFLIAVSYRAVGRSADDSNPEDRP